MDATFEPESVRAFEHAGWQRAAAGYDATFARATAQFVEVLLDAAGVAEGSRVLDLCCGTGLVTAAAACRTACIVPGDLRSLWLIPVALPAAGHTGSGSNAIER